MIQTSNISVSFSSKKLFENVNLKFLPGNCYGIIGANGAGKSTFLKVLAGVEESTSGDVIIEKGARLSFLQQDHFKYDHLSILETVIKGHGELADVSDKRTELYAKADFTEEDGYLAADLEEKFADLNGWEAESDAEKLLNGLNLNETDYSKKMSDLEAADKVKILLAQSLFGSPDILLLDEPTNHLDFYAIKWLEEFIGNYDKTVIVVSHDRHFLNNVCTNIVDIDFGEARMFVGNYDFWRESSQLAQKMLNDSNSKKEEKIKELENFIARFSANASKSAQATSRKKALDKITLDDIKPSTRKYPFINLPIEREIGTDVVSVENLNKTVDGEQILSNVSFTVNGDEKVVFLSRNDYAISTLFKLMMEEEMPDSGEINFGITVSKDYLPRDNSAYFGEQKVNLVDWLRNYCVEDQTESYVRGFLGKMLFSGEEPLKYVRSLSGGEKVRMMFSKLMLSKANTLILDQPTNHLDLESIQSVNEGLSSYKGCLMFASHDYSFIESIATKVIEITPKGAFVYNGTFNEFLSDDNVKKKINSMYE